MPTFVSEDTTRPFGAHKGIMPEDILSCTAQLSNTPNKIFASTTNASLRLNLFGIIAFISGL